MPQRRYIEHVGSLTNEAFTLPDNPARRAVILANNSDADMTYRIGAQAATATAGIPLTSGTGIALDGDLCPDGDVTLFCAGTDKAYTVYEVVG